MTVYLVRHAHAVSRAGHSGPDLLRPLSDRGRRQAEALRQAFDHRPVHRVLSSPAVRCRDTVLPLAAALGLDVEDRDALAEGQVPLGAHLLIEELAGAGTDSVLCSHGDVIPWLIEALAADGVPQLGGTGCRKGSIWELSADRGHIRRARYHPEPGSLSAR